MLKEFRTIIKTAAPRAQERISYGMSYYYYKRPTGLFRTFEKTYWTLHTHFYRRGAQK